VILVHQDVLCTPDNREQLDQCIVSLEAHDPKWAVAGNAGEHQGDWFVRISDAYAPNQSTAPFYPHIVNMLDGNILIIKRSTNVRILSRPNRLSLLRLGLMP